MKRLLTKLGRLLILGGVTTLAISWGCALWVPRRNGLVTNSVPARFEELWSRQRPGGSPETPDLHVVLGSYGFRRNLAIAAEERRGSFRFTNLWVDEAGWPLPAMQAQGWNDELPASVRKHGAPPVSATTMWTLRVPADVLPLAPADSNENRWIPLKPLWPGVAVDTVFFATAWQLGFALLTTARTLARFRRGRCPSCAYDLRGDYIHACSECGWERKRAHNA